MKKKLALGFEIIFRLLQNEKGIIRPNPDFWAADLFHKIMIGTVLESRNDFGSEIHHYVIQQPEKSVRILILNYDTKSHWINVNSELGLGTLIYRYYI